ncbi:MAG: AMP-binding protein, partial [Rhodospirillales bacterium]
MKSWPSLIAMFQEQAKTFENKPFLWAKKDGSYQSISWRESAEIVSALARGLVSLGISPGDRIVLCSENRPEWPLAHLAIMAAGGITVPAYTTNTVNDHAHILANSGAKGAIVSTKELAANLLPATHQTGGVKFIISADDMELSQSSGPDIYT